MLIFLEKKATVSEIRSTLVFGIYTLWNFQCSMDGPMYHLDSPCGAHDSLLFGLLWITTLVPGGASGVWLQSNYPDMCAYDDMWGLFIDCLIRFRLIFTTVVICTTIGVGSVYLLCILPL